MSQTCVQHDDPREPSKLCDDGDAGKQVLLACTDTMVDGEKFAAGKDGKNSTKADPVVGNGIEEKNLFGPWMLVRKPIKRRSTPRLQEGNRSNHYANHERVAVRSHSGSRFEFLNDSEETHVDQENTHVGSSENHNRMSGPSSGRPNGTQNKKAHNDKPNPSKPKPSKAVSSQGKPSVARDKGSSFPYSAPPNQSSSDIRPVTGRRVSAEEEAILQRMSYM
ncbi:hypothetical protein RIF29_25423 [Crotalaria pallida]|uniref:Uncharacterized protein n=1 Tax=Crotalaria pallida TaxID=3830 RepID=A0AAN9HXG7_CROPI